MKNKAKIFYGLIVAATGWFGILLQLYLMLTGIPEKSILEKLLNFFSYFTVLTNTIVAYSITITLTRPLSAMGNFFSKSSTESAIVVYIVMVGIIHYFFLRELVELEGWNLFADTILHKIIPLLYAFYWIIFVNKGELRWKDSFRWLIYPVLYLSYVLIRGAIDGFYPYPFADAGKLGYSGALLNGILVIVSFYALSLLLIGSDKLMQKK